MKGRQLWQLAGRNLRRHRARSGLAGGAIFGGVLVVLVLSALTQGFGRLTRDDLVLGRSGALQVHRAGYFALRDAPPVELDLPEVGVVPTTIAATPGVLALTPRLIYSAVLHVGGEGKVCHVRGIDLAREARVLPWRASRASRPSRAPAPGVASASAASGPSPAPEGALLWLGDRLAARLGATHGTAATLEVTTPTGQLEARDVVVGGTFYGSELESMQVAELPLAEAQLLAHVPGRVTEYLVALIPGADQAATQAALQRALGPDYEVTSWEALDPNIVDVIDLLQQIIDVVGLISLVIVSFGIVNCMRMSVHERTREIGTLMALGARRSAIAQLFVCEAAVLALLAVAAAAVLAWAAVGATHVAGGIFLAPPGQEMVSYPLLPVLGLGRTLATAAIALGGALAAAAAPAYRAASLRPVEALQAI